MTMDPFLGLVLISAGGLAAASFYTPFKRVRGWAWETFWLAFGVVSWVIGPWTVACLVCPDLRGVLASVSMATLVLCYVFGALWGIGSLTNGLAIRYMGLSLGFALPMGVCAAAGTLLPPLIKGELAPMLGRTSGVVALVSVVVGLVGIAICGRAGVMKDRELSAERKAAAVSEFNLSRGVWLSVLSGIMSACMAFAIEYGGPISKAALGAGTPALYQNAPMFVVILLGGFTSNCVWCLSLGVRNRTVGQFGGGAGAPAAANYLLCFLAGAIWYLQFLFYGMGRTTMGRYDFTSWSIFMACIIIFSNLWGVLFGEWAGTGRRTKVWLVTGLVVLALSAVLTSYGDYLQSHGS